MSDKKRKHLRVGAGRIGSIASALLGFRRPCILVPASSVEKTRKDLLGLSQEFKDVRVLSYETLAQKGTEELEGSDRVILDEAHTIDKYSLAVVRVHKYLQDTPGCRFTLLGEAPEDV